MVIPNATWTIRICHQMSCIVLTGKFLLKENSILRFISRFCADLDLLIQSITTRFRITLFAGATQPFKFLMLFQANINGDFSEIPIIITPPWVLV